MRLLLDTHVLLWWLTGDATLSKEATAAIADQGNVVFVSAATGWEIAIKRASGKLESPGDLEAQLKRNRFDPLPITFRHAWAAGALPRHHEDPFDRMLVAQAMLESLTMATRDARISQYGVPILAA